MSGSIIQDLDNRQCYLCALLDRDTSVKKMLHVHHIFGGPYRKASEKFGLTVHLCPKHHTGDANGCQEAVHSPAYNDYGEMLHQIGQHAYERKAVSMGSTPETARYSFVMNFGQSYLHDGIKADEEQAFGKEWDVKSGSGKKKPKSSRPAASAKAEVCVTNCGNTTCPYNEVNVRTERKVMVFRRDKPECRKMGGYKRVRRKSETAGRKHRNAERVP